MNYGTDDLDRLMHPSQKNSDCTNDELSKWNDDAIVDRVESAHDIENDQRREKPGHEKPTRFPRCGDSYGGHAELGLRTEAINCEQTGQCKQNQKNRETD